MLKKIGSWIGSVKRYVSNVQNDVSNFENFDVDEKSANDKKTQTELDNGKE